LHEPKINEALIKAAGRGVEVQVTVESMCNFDRPKPHAQERAKQIYSAFDDAGIKSRFFTRQIMVRGKPGYLHAKAIIVDGARAWVGSMNGSKEAATMNREYGLFFDNQTWIKKLSGIMNADHHNAGTESWQESLACKKDGK
jgi:phosphatidylserine/phosphatidylglycerophosphate/cardiolipin synthase-like enzyme